MNYHKKQHKMVQSDKNLKSLIKTLEEVLSPAQNKINQNFGTPKWPIGMIIGSPRSGSTVFLQFLAATGIFAYPTNFLARFAYAPYIGAMIQKMLFDESFDYQGQFSDIQSSLSFDSELGISRGALATNEFYYFWRTWIKKTFPEPLSISEISKIDFKKIAQALSSIEAVLSKPFCTKGMLHQFNLKEFYQNQPYSFYFRIMREPFYICQSLWHAREKYFGDRSQWYSAKPKEYRWLKEMDIHHQIAGQVYFTEKAISEGLKHVPEGSQLTVTYESFCRSPEDIYLQIVKKYSDLGCKLPKTYSGPKSFNNSNKVRLSKADEEKIKEAYEYFSFGKN